MAIFRGIGGAGDSTTDATVTAVTEQATNAANSATNAATSASSASSSASAASTSASNASSSASAASTSAANAATSASNAASSASSANTAATNAAASETAAGASETAAAASESAAATSASNASSSASTATTKASEASASASAASTSASNAATSASNAAASESAASTSEGNAATSETNAANSASAASGSASSASSSASAASASETAAAASESAAATSASNAATSETNAASSASTATTQAGIASSAATTATTQASNAATSASSAATSASNAASSASSAASSASSASASADAALAALDNFDDRYLGQKVSDPSVDNDGNALVAGSLYFNTTDDVMKVYEGSSWVAAYASLSGALLVANNLSDVSSVSAARTNLGLAASATTDTTNASNISSGTLSTDRLDNSGVTAGTYGSGSAVPNITVDAKGRVTSATTSSLVIPTYSTATSTATGIIKLASDTDQTEAANTVTATSGRTYGVQLNASDQAVVNVPWTDTTYTLPAATSTARGGIELGSDTAQTVAANTVTSTTSRTYALQVNSDGQGVVNVPWVDTVNTSASNLTSGTLPNARLSGTYTDVTLQTNGGNTHYTTPNSGSASTNDRTVFGLAQYKSDLSNATGAIVFYAPTNATAIMHRFRIEGYLYSGGSTVCCIVQGYRDAGAWTAVSKVNLGITDVQVRLAVETSTGKNCVILGDVGTVWSYPMMAITHAMFSHSGVTDAYCKDWTVGAVTSLSGFSNITGNIGNTSISTSITGSAFSAAILTTTRTINGVSFNGSSNITVEPYVENDESTNATRYITFVDNSTAAYKRLNEDSSLTYNPSTNTLTAGTFSGALSGTATNATNVTGTTTASIPTSALASGTADSSTVLLGDRTWGTLSGGVTSLNGQTGAITNTSINSIGSYCFAHELNATSNPGLVVDSTYSPSNLYAYSGVGTYTAFSSYGLTGTWRCMPGSRTAPAGSSYYSKEAPLVRVS